MSRSKVPGASDLGFSTQAGRRLLSQRWPLNIRELSHVLGVAAALAEGPLIERAHLIERSFGAAASPEGESLANPEELRGRLVALLEKHKGNVSDVARDMGKRACRSIAGCRSCRSTRTSIARDSPATAAFRIGFRAAPRRARRPRYRTACAT